MMFFKQNWMFYLFWHGGKAWCQNPQNSVTVWTCPIACFDARTDMAEPPTWHEHYGEIRVGVWWGTSVHYCKQEFHATTLRYGYD